MREAEEGQRREAGEWGNKLCWETNKCTVNEGNNTMSHKKDNAGFVYAHRKGCSKDEWIYTLAKFIQASKQSLG